MLRLKLLWATLVEKVDQALDWLPGPGLMYIMTAQGFLILLNQQIAELAPEGYNLEPVTAGLTYAVSVLGGLALAIRRMSEVPALIRGLSLPDDAGMVITATRGRVTTTDVKGKAIDPGNNLP